MDRGGLPPNGTRACFSENGTSMIRQFMTPSPFCRSVRPKILKPKKLTGYLAGVAGTAALLSASQADAAVTAVTFGFGSVYDVSDGNGKFWVGRYLGPYGDLFGHTTASSTGKVWLGYPTSGGAVYNNGASGSNGRVSFFADGTVIGNGTQGAKGYGYFNSSNASLDLGGDQTNQNIGFKTGAGNWGWANVSWNEAALAVTINSAYVESVRGQSITVGDTGITAAPEPSRALLALAGLGGVALRRRRKQAA